MDRVARLLHAHVLRSAEEVERTHGRVLVLATEEGLEGPPRRGEGELFGLVPPAPDQGGTDPLLVPDQDEVDGVSLANAQLRGGAARELPQGGAKLLLVLVVDELLGEQRLPVGFVVVGPKARHGHVELEALHASGPEELDAHLLGAELQVAEHEARAAAMRRNEREDLMFPEVVVDLPVREGSEAEVALVGRLVRGEVHGIEGGEQDDVGDVGRVLDLDPDGLDPPLGQVDAEGPAGLPAAGHRHRDPHCEPSAEFGQNGPMI